MRQKIAAAVLGLSLLVPAAPTFAVTHHHRARTHTRTVYVTRHKHYSRTRGTVVGAAAGALLGHGVKGALIGGAVGNAVQEYRNKH